MHIVKPKDNRPHLGIEFEHYMPGEMNKDGAAKIHAAMPEKIRGMVDYFYEVLNYDPVYDIGYEAKLCTPEEDYVDNLTTLINFLRENKAITVPQCGEPRFGLHIHVDLRFKDYITINKIKAKLRESKDNLFKYIGEKRQRFYGHNLLRNRGFQTVEIPIMDSNFDLKERIIPYIEEIIKIKNLAIEKDCDLAEVNCQAI